MKALIRAQRTLFLALMLSPVLIAEEEQLPGVKVEKAENRPLYDLYLYPVSLESQKESEICSDMAGIIREIRVDIGQKVRAGDPLLILQHTQADYSPHPFLVRSPIDGSVASLAKKTGARVSQGELLAHIIDPGKLHMISEVPEAELRLLRKGLQGEAKFRQIDRSLPVLISGISPLVRPASGTASAKLIFREDDMPEDLRQQLADRLHPGSIGMAEFRLNQREGIAVPRHAVSTERQKHLVLTVSDGKVLRKEVTIGKETEERIEITQGLSAGELVITRKNQYLRNGEKVRTDTDGSVHE